MSDLARFEQRKGLGKISMIMASGTALFSDGYQNGVVGAVNTILRKLYPVEYTTQHASVFNSMGFAGTVVGMLSMGYAVDRIGRKFGMMLATIVVAIFAALAAGAYSGGNITGMLNALSAYRFLIGIGIGAEYPAGSVAASENTEDPGIKKGSQHMLFALATNVAIDVGFVIAAFVPLVMVLIFGSSPNRLPIVWRMSFGFGILPPLAVLIWRLRMHETLRYQKESMQNCPTPYWLIFKRYWKSMLGLSVAWFIYDFISYPFGIYSSTIIGIVIPQGTLIEQFGWAVVINLFYIPGCVIGAFVVDRVGPKRLMVIMLLCQAVVGFGMSGAYVSLTNHVAGFAVVYGIFLSLGEAGPGNCLGLLASKSWPTAIRGQAYGAAAAIGKIGAFAGTYAFPQIIDAFPAGPAQASGPFWIGSGLAIVSAITVFFLVPEIPADHMTNEDAAFRAYLEENGFDTSRMGLISGSESRIEEAFTPEEKLQEKLSNEPNDSEKVSL